MLINSCTRRFLVQLNSFYYIISSFMSYPRPICRKCFTQQVSLKKIEYGLTRGSTLIFLLHSVVWCGIWNMCRFFQHLSIIYCYPWRFDSVISHVLCWYPHSLRACKCSSVQYPDGCYCPIWNTANCSCVCFCNAFRWDPKIVIEKRTPML